MHSIPKYIYVSCTCSCICTWACSMYILCHDNNCTIICGWIWIKLLFSEWVLGWGSDVMFIARSHAQCKWVNFIQIILASASNRKFCLQLKHSCSICCYQEMHESPSLQLIAWSQKNSLAYTHICLCGHNQQLQSVYFLNDIDQANLCRRKTRQFHYVHSRSLLWFGSSDW